MSKEEMIDILKGLVFGTFDRTTAKEREALDMVIKVLERESCKDMGEVSDGYHTFNQLYHQRAVLFATIVNQNKDKSWKSFKHSDGNYCFDSNGEWFIVGIDTPQGNYTYHYAKEYWDMFDCEELECGKEWDGHTEEDVTRLLSLEQEPCEDAIGRAELLQRSVISVPFHMSDGSVDYVDMVFAADICRAKPVQPQPKTGHWIAIEDEEGNIVGHYCSKCDLPLETDDKTMYCPHCGCRMSEVWE